jgi:hypothetical protein
VKFGLAALVTQVFAMAPLSAGAVVILFFLARSFAASDAGGLALALLYAFATPVFFRTGYLNQNLIVAHLLLAGFALLYLCNSRRAAFGAGLAAGGCLLMDYSGVIPLALLALYALLQRRQHFIPFAAACCLPVLLLWQYQWQSFGNPFLPGQHYMPPVEWIDRGYQGVAGPQAELAWMLAFDYRFGLFTTCPLLLLALAAPFRAKFAIPRRELWLLLAIAGATLLFFSCVNYTRLQFNTGIRYMSPAIPMLFLPAGLLLWEFWQAGRFRVPLAILLAGVTFESWCLAMYRDVERGRGLLEPITAILTGGPQLPAITTLSRVGILPLPALLPSLLLALAALGLWLLWRPAHA